MKVEIINATPHDIHIVDAEGNVIQTIPTSGIVIRLESHTTSVGEVNGIPLTHTSFGGVDALPEEDLDNDEVETRFIVSQMVKNALRHREDLLVPAEVVRDKEGKIIGCRSLGV